MEILKERLGVQNCLNKIAFGLLILFLISLFFSPTAVSIFFILGLVFWFVSQNCRPKALNAFDQIIILQIVFAFIFYFLHFKTEKPFLIFLKDNLRFYLPWFWFSLSFANLPNKYKHLSQFCFVLAGFIIGLIVCLQALGLPIGEYHLRLSGFLSQPYTTSGLLLIGVFINLSLFKIFGRLKNKVFSKFLVLSLILHILALILISQRAVWLALLAGIGFYILFNLKKIPVKTSLGLGFGFASTLLWAYLFLEKFKNKIQNSFNLQNDKAGFGCRIAVWKLNWQSFLKQPLIGQGQAVKYQCFYQELGHAHNIFLQQLVLNGLLGFFVWLSLWVVAFYQLGQRFKQNLPYLACLIALLAEGLFENWYGDSEVQTAFFFLLAGAF